MATKPKKAAPRRAKGTPAGRVQPKLARAIRGDLRAEGVKGVGGGE